MQVNGFTKLPNSLWAAPVSPEAKLTCAAIASVAHGAKTMAWSSQATLGYERPRGGCPPHHGARSSPRSASNTVNYFDGGGGGGGVLPPARVVPEATR
jgi:hypothetical protein